MAVFPIVAAAIIVVSVTAYAMCAVAGEVRDYSDPSDWSDLDDA